MINILKAEFFKLRKSKALLICLIVLAGYIALEMGIMTSLSALLRNTVEGAEEILDMYGLTASSALRYFANDFLILTIIATIIICGFYSGEHRYGLIKNSLCVGVSRNKVYFAKFLMTMIVSAAFYCIATFIYMAVLGIIGGWGSVSAATFMGFWFLELLLFLSLGALVFMFSMLTKSTGATIGITLGLVFLFNILSVFGVYASVVPGLQTGNNLLSDILNEISMLFSAGQIIIAASMDLTGWRLVEAVLVGVVTLIGAGAAGLAVFRKQDQK